MGLEDGVCVKLVKKDPERVRVERCEADNDVALVLGAVGSRLREATF